MPKFSFLLHARPLWLPVDGGDTVMGGVYAWRGASGENERAAREAACQAFLAELRDEASLSEVAGDPLQVVSEQVKPLATWRPLALANTGRVFYTDRDEEPEAIEVEEQTMQWTN